MTCEEKGSYHSSLSLSLLLSWLPSLEFLVCIAVPVCMDCEITVWVFECESVERQLRICFSSATEILQNFYLVVNQLGRQLRRLKR